MNFEYNGNAELKNTALHMAIKKENYEIINLLLECKNIDVNIRDFNEFECTNEEEKPALYWAVQEGNTKIVKLLL